MVVAALARFEGQVGGAPREGVDELAVVAEDVEGGADVLALVVLGEDAGGVVGGLFAREDGARGFEELEYMSFGRRIIALISTYITCDLLGQHEVVTFPCCGREVVCVVRSNAAEITVTVTTTSTSRNLETFGGNGTGQ